MEAHVLEWQITESTFKQTIQKSSLHAVIKPESEQDQQASVPIEPVETYELADMGTVFALDE